MRIGITFDLKADLSDRPDLPDDFQEEFDSPATVEAIARVLRGLGHQVELLGDGRELLERLLADPPEFIFNFAEGQGVGRCREARVPAVLEMLGIPFTGSDPLTLAATLDKDCAKRLVASAGVTVPRGAVIDPEADQGTLSSVLSTFTFPVIVKPAWEGSSKGIRNKCLVEHAGDLPAVVESIVRDHRQPVLVEEYIAGDELTVGVIGNAPARVLGVMRVVPNRPTEHFVYSLEVKRDWQRQVRYECPARLADADMAAVSRSALMAYEALGCRDVSRLDFRLRRGVPYFLEVNPLPGLNPDYSDLVILAKQIGMTYTDLVAAIIEAALKRVGRDVKPRPPAIVPPRVTILYNKPVLPLDHADAASEHEILATVKIIGRTLAEMGYDPQPLGVGSDPRALLHGLQSLRPDVVFNLFEGLATCGQTESVVAGLLDWLGVPFTGSPAQALTLARDKVLTKRLLTAVGLPTPDFFVVERLPCPPCPLRWPVIVKPALQDASVGIEQASVVVDEQSLARRVAYIVENYGPPVLVEEFVRGREFHATLIETLDGAGGQPSLVVLPLAEIAFLEQESSLWPIYSYEAKWNTQGREYQATPLRSPVTLGPAHEQRAADLARLAYRAVGCRDYGRVDFRMTHEGHFFILEVNPNPFINSAGVTNGLAATGRTHAEFVDSLIRAALARRVVR
jgi:D-alanine-D-alanine ligase